MKQVGKKGEDLTRSSLLRVCSNLVVGSPVATIKITHPCSLARRPHE
jgi:hypothetical protein